MSRANLNRLGIWVLLWSGMATVYFGTGPWFGFGGGLIITAAVTLFEKNAVMEAKR